MNKVVSIESCLRPLANKLGERRKASVIERHGSLLPVKKAQTSPKGLSTSGARGDCFYGRNIKFGGSKLNLGKIDDREALIALLV